MIYGLWFMYVDDDDCLCSIYMVIQLIPPLIHNVEVS